jgi:tetratricopeptide (TPR) repeat protein
MFKKNSFTTLCLFLLFFFHTEVNQAQVNLDSLQSIWENPNAIDSVRFKAIATYYKNQTFAQPDSVLVLIDYHLDLAQRKQATGEMVTAYKEKAKAYYVKGIYPEATTALLKAIELQQKLNDKIGLARLNNNLGNLYREQNKFFEAVKYYNLSLEIFKANNEENAEADVLNNLGLIYSDIKYNELALDYLLKALTLYEKLNLQDNVGNIWLNIGAVYLENQDYPKANEYAQKALKILEANNNLLSSADCYFLMAKANQHLDKLDNAFHYASKSLRLNQKIENNVKILDTKIYIAELTLLSDTVAATKIGEEVLQQVKPDTDKNTKANLYRLLTKCYKLQNKTELSHQMYDQYIIYNDSILQEKNNLALIKEAINQEYKVKLNKTKAEHQKSQENLKRNQIIRISLLVLFCLVFVLALTLYFRKKNKANREKKDALVKEINQLKQNISTDLSLASPTFALNRTKIETAIARKINETDWTVLTLLLEDPVMSNKEIAEKAFLSVDGIGSSLRRMYDYFEIKDSKYKKISLLMEAIKHSSSNG